VPYRRSILLRGLSGGSGGLADTLTLISRLLAVLDNVQQQRDLGELGDREFFTWQAAAASQFALEFFSDSEALESVSLFQLSKSPAGALPRSVPSPSVTPIGLSTALKRLAC